MVAKNNYFWTEGCKEIDFIANGDIAVVRRVRRVREAYGFRFADVVLAFPDYDGMELEVKLLLDTLHTETPALPKELNDKLFYSVLEDYADITVKRERMKKMKADPHYNALQVKYAYAVTCHKAQGGQWKRVFLDQGYMTEDMLTPDYFRWLVYGFHPCYGILYLVELAEGADGMRRAVSEVLMTDDMFSTVWLMFFSLWLSLFERLYSISITFGVNSQAYGVNSVMEITPKAWEIEIFLFISLIHKEEKA